MAIRNGKVEKAPVLVRVVKFPISPTPEQMSTLQKVSDNLWQIWNDCLEWRQQYFNEHIKPPYERLKTATPEEVPNIKSHIKAMYANAPVYHVAGVPDRSQASWLTNMRQSRSDFAAIPCGWQQECLKILEGDYLSFGRLRQKGDRTARPPRHKDANGFCEIQGCVSWQLQTSSLLVNPQKELGEVHQHAIANSNGLDIVLSPGKSLPGGVELRFAVPEYQRLVLSRAVKLNKFTLYREKKNNKKRFWISIAYAVPEPVSVSKTDKNTVFVAFGASHLAVISEKDEKTIDLWRPDRHWLPLINQAKSRGLVPVLQSKEARDRSVASGYVSSQVRLEAEAMEAEIIFSLPERARKHNPFLYADIPPEQRPLWLEPKQKGSKGWESLFLAVDRMYELMRFQQLQNQREVVARELRLHGVHFVLIEHSPIRAKDGALADKSKDERRGPLGLNWQVQNTGSMARLRQLLEQKAVEWGGSVSTMKLEHYPSGDVREKKLEAARLAKWQYLNAS
jgi:hypothetical protein